MAYQPHPTEDFYFAIRSGTVPGYSVVHKFGRNDSVPNGSWDGVLSLSGAFPFLSTATTVRVKAGGNANDTAAGSGAQAVTVEGLDQTGAFASESIELAGGSASSSTTTTFIRVYRAYITDLRAGTYSGANDGNIIIEDTAGTTDLIQITANEGQTQFCCYTIPLGKTGYLYSAIVQADARAAADFRLFTRESILDTTTPFAPVRLKFFWDGVLGISTLKPYTPLQKLPALTDVWIEARGGGADTEASADMEIILKDD
jgi:hypothetical protein